MSEVSISGVTKAFGDVVVLEDFTETFADREFVTLLGPSGCGKTTMLRIIAGFERPTAGTVSIGGKVVSSGSVFVPPEKRGIGMVFQSYAVWPHMTVFDNVAYPLKIQKLPKEEIRTRVEKVLEAVHLSAYAGRIPSQLSGGQQQRVALGRALVAEPRLLLLDEPLSNLDAKLRESMRYEIKEIQKTLGITVVYVTHDQIEAMAMSDRIVVLNGGRIQQVGTPMEIYKSPVNPFVADFVGKVDFLQGTAETGAIRLDRMGETLPYGGPLTGRVRVAVRPENVSLVSDGPLHGTLRSKSYLGDIVDCRVELGGGPGMGGQSLRVVLPGEEYSRMEPGDDIALDIREFLTFPKE